MDFLENAINKTREAFDVACKKTGEIVTVEKLRFELTSVKSKREKDYASLGRLCYGVFKDDENASDEVKILIAEIMEKNKKINQLNRDIMSAKEKDSCPNCGAGVANNATFCSNCGKPL